MSVWRRLRAQCQTLLSKKPSTQRLSTQNIGQGGENAAASHVQHLGMRILYRNWRHASWELDLICQDSDGIIFVEVKTRKAQGMTSPLESITAKKRATLIKAAHLWLAAHEAQGVYDKACRFAVVAVTYTEHPIITYKVEFYDHAFDLSHTSSRTKRSALGGGNTSW